MEPKYPGLVERYVNLGDCYDRAGLQPLRQELMGCMKGYKACYQRAYRCLTAAAQVGDRPKRRPGGTLENRLAVPAAPQGPAPAEGPLRHPPLPRRQIGVVQQPLHRSRRAPALLGPAGQLLPGALHLGQRAPHLPGHSPRADRSLQLQCPGGVGPVSGQMGFIHGNMGGVRSRHGGSS